MYCSFYGQVSPTSPHRERSTPQGVDCAVCGQSDHFGVEFGQMTVEPRTDDDELLHCIVEIPKGSRNKYEWDERLGAIKLDRFLFSSLVYPTDYGYIPKTLADDGDALDVMVIVSEATFPGCVILVKPIALFRMRDEEGEGHAQARVRPRPPDG